MKNIVCLTLLCISMVHAVDGDLDATFGNAVPTDGKLLWPFDNGNEDVVTNALVVRFDGVIIAGGAAKTSAGSNDERFALSWFDANGTATVAQTETVILQTSKINGLAVQPDGKVIAVGTAMRNSPARNEFAIARYTFDGQLDTSFGTNGVTTISFFSKLDGMTVIDAQAEAHAVALTKNGKIVVVGQAQDINALPSDPNSFYAIAVLNPDGTLDTNFAEGDGRKVFSSIMYDGFTSILSGTAKAVAIQLVEGQERIVFVGQGLYDTSPTPIRFFQIGRVTLDGYLDLSFNTYGVDQLPFALGDFSGPIATGVDVYPDGRIIAVGQVFINSVAKTIMVLTRRLKNGGNDPTFTLPMNVYGSASRSIFTEGVVVQNDKKFAVVGTVDGGSQIENMFVGRFNEDGTPDSTFGSASPLVGLTETDFGSASDARAVAIDQEGRLVAAGSARFDAEHRQLALARYQDANESDQVFVVPTVDSPVQASNVNAQVVFTGDAQNPSNITVYIDGQVQARLVNFGDVSRTLPPEQTNRWTYYPTVPLAQGKHVLEVVAEYKSGNMNAMAERVCFGVDQGPLGCLAAAIRNKYCDGGCISAKRF